MNSKNLIHHWPSILLILFIIVIVCDLIFSNDLSKWVNFIVGGTTVISFYKKQDFEQRNAKDANEELTINKLNLSVKIQELKEMKNLNEILQSKLDEKKKQSYILKIENLNQELDKIEVDNSSKYSNEYIKEKKAFNKIYETFCSLNTTIYIISKSIKLGLLLLDLNSNRINYILSKDYYETLIPITSICNKLLQNIDSDQTIDYQTKKDLIESFFLRLNGADAIVLNLMSHILDYERAMPVIEEKYMTWGCDHFPQRFNEPIDYELWKLIMKKSEDEIDEEIKKRAFANSFSSSS